MNSTTATSSISFDSNILIYSVDLRDPVKHALANRIVSHCITNRAPITLQCLNEFYRTVTKKSILPPPQATHIVEVTRRTTGVFPPAESDLVEAMRMHQQHNLPFWDALLLATAQRAGCKVLFTEDFQDGRTFDGLTICNPFKLSTSELDELLG